MYPRDSEEEEEDDDFEFMTNRSNKHKNDTNRRRQIIEKMRRFNQSKNSKVLKQYKTNRSMTNKFIKETNKMHFDDDAAMTFGRLSHVSRWPRSRAQNTNSNAGRHNGYSNSNNNNNNYNNHNNNDNNTNNSNYNNRNNQIEDGNEKAEHKTNSSSSSPSLTVSPQSAQVAPSPVMSVSSINSFPLRDNNMDKENQRNVQNMQNRDSRNDTQNRQNRMNRKNKAGMENGEIIQNRQQKDRFSNNKKVTQPKATMTRFPLSMAVSSGDQSTQYTNSKRHDRNKFGRSVMTKNNSNSMKKWSNSEHTSPQRNYNNNNNSNNNNNNNNNDEQLHSQRERERERERERMRNRDYDHGQLPKIRRLDVIRQRQKQKQKEKEKEKQEEQEKYKEREKPVIVNDDLVLPPQMEDMVEMEKTQRINKRERERGREREIKMEIEHEQRDIEMQEEIDELKNLLMSERRRNKYLSKELDSREDELKETKSQLNQIENEYQLKYQEFKIANGTRIEMEDQLKYYQENQVSKQTKIGQLETALIDAKS